MRRALALAELGGGQVRANPRVGCVVTEAATGRVLAEGWHRAWGGPHAEAEALALLPADFSLADTQVFVTLEPCAHHGKRPPCADLLIARGARQVVVATLDPFPLVAGQGVARLRAAGCQVRVGLLEAEARWLNRRFLSAHERGRPWVVLKWAESADGFLAGPDGAPVAITSEATRRLVHRWRTEEAAILVGAGTALADNPRLDARHWPGGPAPRRVVLTGRRALPPTLLLHAPDPSGEPTLFYSVAGHAGQLANEQVPAQTVPSLPALLADLRTHNLHSVLVEGGATVLRAFLAADLWDEVRVLRNPALRLGAGVPAPVVPLAAHLLEACAVAGDEVQVWGRRAVT